MWKSITGRITLIAVLTVVSIIVLVPSLTDQVPAGWKDRVPKINLGLDLQGGVFLRLAVEIDKAIENTSMRYADADVVGNLLGDISDIVDGLWKIDLSPSGFRQFF